MLFTGSNLLSAAKRKPHPCSPHAGTSLVPGMAVFGDRPVIHGQRLIMQSLCRVHAEFMQKLCSVYAAFMQRLCRVYAEFMQC